MGAKEELKKQIERERKWLDAAVEAGLEQRIVFERSHRLDELINRYYALDLNQDELS